MDRLDTAARVRVLKGIRIRNLRSLVDTQYVELRPLNILVGTNSSGKSTFLRTFPLLKQSVETDTAGPIVWYGRHVDFGSLREAVTSDAMPKEVVLSYKVLLASGQLNERFLFSDENEKIEVDIDLHLLHSDVSETSYLGTVELSVLGHTLKFHISEHGAVTSLTVDELEFIRPKSEIRVVRTRGILPILYRSERSGPDAGLYRTDSPFVDQIRELIEGFDKRVAKSFPPYTFYKPLTTAAALARFKRLSNSKVWQKKTAKLTVEDERIRRLAGLILANSAPSLLSAVNQTLASIARNVAYVQPFRMSAQRYYRSQDLAVQEVDPRGENLAMFFRSLSPRQQQSFGELVSRFLGVRPSLRISTGHIELLLQESPAAGFNLADVGYGYTQVLPVFAQVWSILEASNRRMATKRGTPMAQTVFAVEQPELHLHPAAHAVLADLLADTVAGTKRGSAGVIAVVETHSETIINRIGSLIQEKKLSAEDVQVLVFERAIGQRASGLRIAHYSGDGELVNWPFGFFSPAVG